MSSTSFGKQVQYTISCTNQSLLLQIASWLDEKGGVRFEGSTELVSIVLKTFSGTCVYTSISPEANLTTSVAY